jgi:hypothetical protein
MKGYIDLIISSEEIKRVQVEITRVNPDGSFDYAGDECKGYHSNQPLYDENGKQATPTASVSAVGELMKKVEQLEKDMQEVKRTKQTLQ